MTSVRLVFPRAVTSFVRRLTSVAAARTCREATCLKLLLLLQVCRQFIISSWIVVEIIMVFFLDIPMCTWMCSHTLRKICPSPLQLPHSTLSLPHKNFLPCCCDILLLLNLFSFNFKQFGNDIFSFKSYNYSFYICLHLALRSLSVPSVQNH